MKTLTQSLIFSLLLFCGAAFGQTNWKVDGNDNAADSRVGLNTNFDMIFETNRVDRAVIENDGDMGVGTLFPSAQLHINSGVGEDGLRVQVNGSTKLLLDDLGGLTVGSLTAAPANGLFVSGNVGFGTSLPDNKVHILKGSAGIITGNVNAPLVVENSTSCYIDLLAPSTAESGILFGDNLNAQDGGIIYHSGNDMQFRTNGNVTRMTLFDNGDLSLSGNLAVSGEIGFGSVEEIKDGGGFTIHVNSNIDHETDNLDGLGTSTNRWVDVWAVDGTINTSDAREKSNIKNLNYGITDLMKLRPVSYTWTTNPERGTKLGLVAQELQEVIPEVVRDWEYKADEATGKREVVASARLGVMYDDLIPVLVKSIQDQQATITELENRLAALESGQSSKASVNEIGQSKQSFLEQNVPNPFSASTTIRFQTNADAKEVMIQITNAKGEVVKLIQATGNEVTIQANDLPSGIYFYALLVDGVKMDVKRMSLTK